MLDLLKVYLKKPVQRGAAEMERLAQLQKSIFRSSTSGSATTSLSRPLKQLGGSRVTRKSL